MARRAAFVLAVVVTLAGCSAAQPSVAPSSSPSTGPGYTSNRNNPVQLDSVDTATITFDLVADEFDPDTLHATHSSITWSYSLESVESADDCQLIETAEGGGTWEADDGPTVMFGWSAPDGTLFGMDVDETRYVLQVIPPTNNLPEDSPQTTYQHHSSLCGGQLMPDFRLPYATLAFVDGLIPEDRTAGALSGTRTRTLPRFGFIDVPTIETVTWSIPLGP